MISFYKLGMYFFSGTMSNLKSLNPIFCETIKEYKYIKFIYL